MLDDGRQSWRKELIWRRKVGDGAGKTGYQPGDCVRCQKKESKGKGERGSANRVAKP